MNQQPETPLRLALPKGRMSESVVTLLADAGVRLRTTHRGYRPSVSLPGVEVKILKPQNIVEMLHMGSRDLGFAGADWAAELDADVVEVLDTGLEPVRIVAAAPASLLVDGKLPRGGGGGTGSLRVASEMERLTTRWIKSSGLDAQFIRSYGATEVLPPEDADCIVDIAASGATLDANGLVIIDELMRSSTRLYASRQAMDDPAKNRRIEDLALVLRSVLVARKRVMLEVNVGAAQLAAIVEILPCMREPTVSSLHADAGYAVKAVVRRAELPGVVPKLKAAGGTDIVISPIEQVVP